MRAKTHGGRRIVRQRPTAAQQQLAKQSEDGWRGRCRKRHWRAARMFSDATLLQLTVRRDQMTLGTIVLIILVYCLSVRFLVAPTAGDGVTVQAAVLG